MLYQIELQTYTEGAARRPLSGLFVLRVLAAALTVLFVFHTHGMGSPVLRRGVVAQAAGLALQGYLLSRHRATEFSTGRTAPEDRPSPALSGCKL